GVDMRRCQFLSLIGLLSLLLTGCGGKSTTTAGAGTEPVKPGKGGDPVARTGKAPDEATRTVKSTSPGWPQWQGPDRTNVSRETGLLKSWPSGGPRLLWTCTNAGAGFSGPAIVGDRLYHMGGRNGREFLIALDVRQGNELWAADVG